MNNIKKEEQEVLIKLMAEKKLSSETRLYRYTSRDYLIEDNDLFYLKAKLEPKDMVIDRYHGNWQSFLGSEIGMGISFLLDQETEYEKSDRVCVEVYLKDVLNQGGLLYEVTSLPAYINAVFCTIPSSKVPVKILDK